MTRRFSLSEDALRELRSPVVPVDDPDVVEARRRRTVSHLQALQARTVVRRQIAGSWRKRLLVAAAILLPSGALAATWAALKTPSAEARRDHGVSETAPPAMASPSGKSSVVRNTPSIPFESLPQEERAGIEARGTGAVLDESSRQVDGALKTSSRAWLTSTTRSPGASGTGPRDSDGSTLAAENALMQGAMTAARDGNDARAVQLLGGLLARYPKSPLAQNAEVERFRALGRLGEGRAAARFARRYLGEHPDGMAREEARRLGVGGPPLSSDDPRR